MVSGRSFQVNAEKDARAPVLIQVLQHLLAMRRADCYQPVGIVMSGDVYQVISTYMNGGGKPIDKLFNCVVVANLDDGAEPFVIVCEERRARL